MNSETKEEFIVVLSYTNKHTNEKQTHYIKDKNDNIVIFDTKEQARIASVSFAIEILNQDYIDIQSAIINQYDTLGNKNKTKPEDKPVWIEFKNVVGYSIGLSLSNVCNYATSEDQYIIELLDVGNVYVTKETFENIQKVIEQHATVIKC